MRIRADADTASRPWRSASDGVPRYSSTMMLLGMKHHHSCDFLLYFQLFSFDSKTIDETIRSGMAL
jgi:hypothetical protein